MRTSESIDKIATALVKARASMSAVGKSGFNSYDKYKYANLLDYTEAVEPSLLENQLAIVTSGAEAEQLENRKTSKGNDEYVVRLKLTMRLVHSSGQWIEVDAYGDGQDRGDKGIYKAHTGARKYGIASLFGLATTDDPEDAKPDLPPPPPAQRATPTRNNGTNDKKVLAQLVGQWSGAPPEMLPQACRDTMSAAAREGVIDEYDPKNISDSDRRKVSVWVQARAEAGDDFIETVQGNHE